MGIIPHEKTTFTIICFLSLNKGNIRKAKNIMTTFIYFVCRTTPTKYLYIQSTTGFVPSSESGLSQPLSRERVYPPPGPKGGGYTGLRLRGWGSPNPNSDDWRKSLALCLLSDYSIWNDVTMRLDNSYFSYVALKLGDNKLSFLMKATLSLSSVVNDISKF
jgi:hypothetical protein